MNHKFITLFLILSFIFQNINSQVFWNEDFGVGCNQGQIANTYIGTNGGWTITATGLNQSSANEWFISGGEVGGQAIGSCGGTKCNASGLSNQTLHVGLPVSPYATADEYAIYWEYNLYFPGWVDIRSITHKRADSPTIDCSGQSNISLTFNYREFGLGAGDNVDLWYYDGTTWSLLSDPPRTITLACPTSSWDNYSINLPPSANNNPNVKIGFQWVNDLNEANQAARSFAVDDITLETVIVPIVEFQTNTSLGYEDDGGLNLTVTMTNPHPTFATSVDVNLTSLDPNNRLNGWTNTTIIFPAGDNTPINVYVAFNDDDNCQDLEQFIFQLDNLTSLGAPVYGANVTHRLNLRDDEKIFELSYMEGFELGASSLLKWTSPSTDWQVNTGAPINGFFNMVYDASITSTATANHNDTQNKTYYSNDDVKNLTAVWRMNVYYPTDPGFGNSLEIDLTKKTTGGNDSGYKLMINDLLGGTDFIMLTRVDNGTVQSSPFSGTSPAVLYTEIGTWPTNRVIGIEVVKNDDGYWTISLDRDGDGLFNNLAPLTSTIGFPTSGGLDNTYTFTNEMAISLSHTSEINGRLKVDDISVNVFGCQEHFYSQSTGDFEDAIWDVIPVGTASAARINQYSTFEIQTGHDVKQNTKQVIKDLTIQSGGIFSFINSPTNLSLTGDLMNFGTFTPGTTSLVSFIGKNPQVIDGLTGQEIQFNEIEIATKTASNQVTLYRDISISKMLYPKRGILDLNGNIIDLKSDANGTAGIYSINLLESDVINGDIKLNRHIAADTGTDGYPGGWVALGSPLIDQYVSDWNTNLITTGFTGSNYPNYTNSDGTSFNNIIHWDETASQYVGATSVSEPLNVNNGYFVYMDANSQSVEMTGDFHKGTHTETLNYTGASGGWNLISNPYPCAIDWRILFPQTVNISPVIYVYDSDSRTYLDYNAASLSGTASPIIASSQSFWVKATNTSPQITFSENIKTKDGGNLFERVLTSNNSLIIALSNVSNHDYAFVGVKENATPNYDTNIDGVKIAIPLPGENLMQISTVSQDEHLLGYNYFESLNNDLEIPIHINVNSAGEYMLNISNLEEFSTSSCIVLHDLLTDETIIVDYDFEYIFESESFDGTRFMLSIGSEFEVSYSNVTCNGEEDGTISVFSNSNNPSSYSWYNENEELIHENNNITSPSIVEGLASGNYIIEVITHGNSCGTRTELIYIDQPQIENFEFSFLASDCANNQSGKLIFDNPEIEEEYSFQVYLEDELIEEGTTHGYLALSMEENSYTIQVQTSCNDYSYEVDLIDANIPEVIIDNVIETIQMNDGEAIISLIATLDNVNQTMWVLSGNVISTESQLEYSFTEAGTYEIALIGIRDLGNCVAMDIIEIEVVGNTVEVESLLESEEITLTRIGNTLEISIGSVLKSEGQIQIINAIGQIILDHTFFDREGIITEDISSLSEGVYIVKVKNSNDIIFSTKFIK